MKVYSFIQDQYSLIPIEVEVSCVSGGSEFEIMGQADSLIKECKHKVFSAFRHRGFEIPSGKKIFVNLRPGHIKKKSNGLDFAIAMGILWELGQIEKPFAEKVLIYGELGLDGKIFCPEDLESVSKLPEGFDCIYTGVSEKKLGVKSYGVSALNDTNWLRENPYTDENGEQAQKEVDQIYVSKELADLMGAIAIGEHSCLFAGPKGTGKSTVVENISSMLSFLDRDSYALSRQINRYFGHEITARPVVAPHHTSTTLAMVGGGAHAVPGEFTRAHGGVLLLDEYLEFQPGVQESLREPMETGYINVSRVGGRREHPADFLLMATTNLCPCGEYFPKKENRCVCRIALRRRYVEKLSGPVLDRFSILCFSDDWQTGDQVYLPEWVEKIRKIQKSLENKVKHSKLPEEVLMKNLEENIDEEELKVLSKTSRRRKKSCLQVAKSFSVLDGRDSISKRDLDKALTYSFRSFESMRWALSRDL